MNIYLRRCIDLARLGRASVGTNPRVGAVITTTHDNQTSIIGEGYHQKFGGKHAEINAIENVKDKQLLASSHLYVSLEPCNITGKTPPCTDAIIQAQIPEVTIGCLDANPKVSGKGVEALRQAGIRVHLSPVTSPFEELNRFFFHQQKSHTPYILLKWAETADGTIGAKSGERIFISCPEALKYVHYLRSEYQAIMIGRTTAIRDNPKLDLRFYPGNSPIKIIIDANLEVPPTANLFTTQGTVVIVNLIKDEQKPNCIYFKPLASDAFMNLHKLTSELYERLGIGSILVEGGRYLLQQFINQNVYNEVQIIRSPNRNPKADIPAPTLYSNFKADVIEKTGTDLIFLKRNSHEQYF